MIDVITQETALERDPESQLELYERMVDHIGSTMRIRRKSTDRTGVLIRLTYNRERKMVFFSFGRDETIDVNTFHHVQVKLDGVWKTICRGKEVNRRAS